MPVMKTQAAMIPTRNKSTRNWIPPTSTWAGKQTLPESGLQMRPHLTDISTTAWWDPLQRTWLNWAWNSDPQKSWDMNICCFKLSIFQANCSLRDWMCFHLDVPLFSAYGFLMFKGGCLSSNLHVCIPAWRQTCSLSRRTHPSSQNPFRYISFSKTSHEATPSWKGRWGMSSQSRESVDTWRFY